MMRRRPPKRPPSVPVALDADHLAADQRRLDSVLGQLAGRPSTALGWLTAAERRLTRLTATGGGA